MLHHIPTVFNFYNNGIMRLLNFIDRQRPLDEAVNIITDGGIKYNKHNKNRRRKKKKKRSRKGSKNKSCQTSSNIRKKTKYRYMRAHKLDDVDGANLILLHFS